MGGALAGGATGSSGVAVDPMKEIIVLAACGANELLPQNPDLPADVFTACLTTPIKVGEREGAAGGGEEEGDVRKAGFPTVLTTLPAPLEVSIPQFFVCKSDCHTSLRCLV